MSGQSLKMPPAKKRRLALLRAHRPVNRRWFLVQGAALTGLGAAPWVLGQVGRAAGAELIRPPTANHDDEAFRAACVRCGLCGTVCENGCIRFFGVHDTKNGALTPYLDLRRRSCTLCMRCTQICPSGALQPVEDDKESIKSQVRMGKAVVDPEHCLSYQGRICGYCHDACPIPGDAIRLTPPALPVVLDQCVGCGRCEELCPQYPAAIRVEREAVS